MQLVDFKRPRVFIPISLAVIITVLSAVVFHPDFQKKMLLTYIGPLVDSLQIDYVHVTPWSVRLDGVTADYAGGHFSLKQGDLRYCLSSLLLLEANIKSLVLNDVRADLAEFNPPPQQDPVTEPGVFPGVLASLQHGLGYRLQQVNINAEVHLPGQQLATVTITGGDISPESSGAIDMKASYLTGQQGEHVNVVGKLAFDQLTRGRFNEIEAALDIDVALARLPEQESASLKLAITPNPLTTDELLAAKTRGEVPDITPETLRLVSEQHDAAGTQRSGFTLDGRYDGNSGVFEGVYHVTANEHLLQRYVQDVVIPPSEEVLNGDLQFNLADLSGELTVISDLQVKDIKETHDNSNLPGLLRLQNNFRLSLLPGMQLRVETINTGLTDEADTRTLASSLPENLDIPLRDVDAFMHQENVLLAFEFPSVPLSWFDVFLPPGDLLEGSLSAAFEITTDTSGFIHLNPVRPLAVTGLSFTQDGETVVQDVNLNVLPRVTYRGDELDISLQALSIDGSKSPAATGEFTATVPLADQAGSISARGTATLEMQRLAELFRAGGAGKQNLPKRLVLDFNTVIKPRTNVVKLDKLDANLLLDGKTRLLQLGLLQPLVLETASSGTRIGNAAGPLATLNISDIDLGWFSALVPGTNLSGKLHRAKLTLAVAGDGVAMLNADQPISLRSVSVRDRDGALLEDVGISVRPSIRLAPEGTRISYRELAITGNSESLLTASGSVTLPGGADRPLLAEGNLMVNVQGFSQQPLIAGALQGAVQAPMQLEASYRLAQDASAIDLSQLSASLLYADGQPRISLQSDSNVRVRTSLGRGKSELGRTRGNVTLSIANLTPEPFVDILAANGLTFSAINGKLVLDSDGKSLRIETLEPLRMTGVAVNSNQQPALLPFTLVADSEAILQGDELRATVKQLSVNFDKDKDVAALDAKFDVILRGHGDSTRVEAMTADVSVSLPGLLEQPAILPGHSLQAGELVSRTTLDASGRLASLTRVQNLKGSEALPLESLEFNVDGKLQEDGSFDITAPITTHGKSGVSDLRITAVHTTRQGENNDITASVNSEVFYLNDVLNTLNAIAGKPAGETEDELSEEQRAAMAAEQQARDMLPDQRAFWDVVPYNRHVTYNIKRLFYTDYLEIANIEGQAEASAGRLSLDQFKAKFHDSPVALDSVMTFVPGQAPYDLKLTASVGQFDLATFLRELDPKSVPMAEGLFDVSVTAHGSSPTVAQYRNNLYFDMHMSSRDGIFRLLDPNDPLVTGSSSFFGVVGETVSYVPTGLFGLGAVARLVNYIKEVPYSNIEAHLVRDESRDVQIRKYIVQSPEILMTAKGGISYQPGIDVMDSPLTMDARIDLRERGAAIFYDLDLLRNERDQYGYWKGPDIKFWGTLGVMESNLGEIIDTAGKGAFLGGITRPISGLIGNIRHLWMDEEVDSVEYTDTPPVAEPEPVEEKPSDSSNGNSLFGDPLLE